jgi:peptidyl-prolyl cis-trans isomerase D
MATKDIQLGEVQKADLGKARGDAAFALAKNGVSKPVKGTFGWVILKVTKIVPGVNKTFDQVKEALKAQVVKQLAADKISEIVNKFEDSMAAGDTITKAAEAAGMKAVHIKAIDQAGQTPDGKPADIPLNSQFLVQVFKADIGIAGDPFQLPDGSAYALKVDGVTPPKLKPLNEVRAKAEAAWKQETLQKTLLAKVKALTATANKDKSLAAIAKTLKVKVVASPALRRGTPSGAVPATLMTPIFEAKPGTTVFGSQDKGTGYVIARITGVTHPPAAMETSPQYAQFKAQLGRQIGNDIPTLLAMAARKSLGVSINQKVVDTVTGDGS